MNAFRPLPSSRPTELDSEDMTQEIDAPLGDTIYRDDLTLSKLEFDEVEIQFDF
jgi:hypothetical protein